MQKSQPLVILIIIVMAIIMAVGFFLALTYIRRRPDLPTGSFVTTVEGVEVTVRMDPEKEFQVLDPGEILMDTDVTLAEPNSEEQAEQVPAEPEQVTEPVEVVLPTSTPEPTLAPVIPTPEPVIIQAYDVLASDTLFSISTRIDTSIALMARYGISQDDLVPGTIIELPVGNPAFCPQPDSQPYAVGEGDTAFSIARRFGVTAEELRQLNNLDESYTVYTATIICVPRR